MAEYVVHEIDNLEAYKQNKGVLFLTYHGHGKRSGHDQMSPHIYYYDELGRRINYYAYNDRNLIRKVSRTDLKSEGIKYLKTKKWFDGSLYARIFELKEI